MANFNPRLAALKDLIKELDDSDVPGGTAVEGSPGEEAAESPDVEAQEGAAPVGGANMSPEDAEKLKELLAKLGA